jgi:hypothetical protein
VTTPKTLRAPTTFDGVPVVERPQQIEKTRELPALDSDDPESELDGADTQAVPRDVIDDDVRYWGCSRRMRRGAIEWTFIGWNEMRP